MTSTHSTAGARRRRLPLRRRAGGATGLVGSTGLVGAVGLADAASGDVVRRRSRASRRRSRGHQATLPPGPAASRARRPPPRRPRPRRRRPGRRSGRRPIVVTASPAGRPAAVDVRDVDLGSTACWASTAGRGRPRTRVARSARGDAAGRRRRRRPGRRAVSVWRLTPRWRGRCVDARVAQGDDRRRRPGRRPRRPRRPPPARWRRATCPVPTTPGPGATTTTSASAHHGGHGERPTGRLTASRSPPKAWPAVTVTSSEVALARGRPRGRRGPAAGRPPRSSRRPRGPPGGRSRHGHGHAGHLAVQTAGHDRAARRGRARRPARLGVVAPRRRRCRPGGSCSGAS